MSEQTIKIHVNFGREEVTASILLVSPRHGDNTKGIAIPGPEVLEV